MNTANLSGAEVSTHGAYESPDLPVLAWASVIVAALLFCALRAFGVISDPSLWWRPL